MTDYISREYVTKCMEDSYKSGGISSEAKAKVTRWLKKAPAADVREVKRGKWEHLTMDKHSQTCSACRTIYYNILDYPFNFCPNCGADMREA